jgi:membrane-associated phospholipid phosphatase
MLVALVAMNYHFVGDVIGGGMLGGIVGVWATRVMKWGD